MLLEVKNLQVEFTTRKGKYKSVDGVDFSLDQGKTLGLVGESGSGKSVTATSLLGLLGDNGRIVDGEALFQSDEGEIDLTKATQARLYKVRGNQISFIFQEPMTALNPVLTVGKQLAEPFILHQGASRRRATEGARQMLKKVQLDPDRTIKSYPHQLSGGMRQRVIIAMALACKPKILIADEPTTALDVTVQAEILRLMKDLQRESGAAILFISHDLRIVRQISDEIAVMYAGQIVERIPAPLLFQSDGFSHPYTEGLIASAPSGKKAGETLYSVKGSPPSPWQLPKGCRFAPRCPFAKSPCVESLPPLRRVAEAHAVRCYYPEVSRCQFYSPSTT